MKELFYILALGSAFLLLFASAELLFYKKVLIAEHTRKIVHVLTGILTLLFPIYLESVWSVALLCGSFLIILLLSKRYHFLKSINQIDRKSSGSLLYPIIVFICFCVYAYMKQLGIKNTSSVVFYLPILIMAICDPLAALIGKRFGKHKIPYYDHKKSWIGSITFLGSAFIITLILLITFPCSIFYLITFVSIIAISATLTELLSNNGWDNFTIPVIVLLNTICFIPYA